MLAKKYLLGVAILSLLFAGVVHAEDAKPDAAPAAAEQAVPAAPAPEAAPVDAVSDKPEATPAAPEFAARGALTCMKCHDSSPVTDILKTPHAMRGDSRAPFGSDNHDCETCHGASPQHVHSTPAPGEHRKSPTVRFNGDHPSPVKERNAVCLTCHEKTQLLMSWAGSQHDSNDIACTNCHTIHVVKDPVLVKQTQFDKCFTCHADKRALSYQYSHHPVREGKVACSDCHNPHGSPGPRLLKELNINETCYTCHAEKRGPLLWEHEPVREDCTICHDPHGSTQASLLKERTPFLCTNCHNSLSGGTHNSNPFGASNLPGNPAQTNAQSTSFRLLGRSCLNCHSNIHGSNSPSGGLFQR